MKLKSSLVGCSGVFGVATELSKRGWIAMPTIRNTEGIDIIKVKGELSTRIQVKARQNSRFFLLSQSAEKLIGSNLFYVFVNILGENDRPEYYIFPSKIVAEYVTRTHRDFLASGGKDNPMRKLPNTYGKLDLEQYKDKWDLLQEAK